MSVPRLRFKEFNEDWNLSPIDQIATVSSGGTPSRTNKEFWNGDIPWVTTSEVKFNIIRDTEQKITEQGLQSSSAKIFPKDTLLIAMYGQGKTRGQIAKLGIAASTNQACAAIILNETHQPDFFFQYLQNQYESLRSLSNDGGQKNLSASLIKSVSVAFPNLPEQTKIANFLTAVDEKITQLTQKCDLLAQYKKGVMQQIFSQQLRFKDDGRDFPEWEVIDLGQIATKVNKKNKDESLKYVLTNSATQGIVSQADYFERDIANQNNLGGYYIVEIDDFVYNPRISVNAPVGPIKRNKLAVGVMSPLYTVFRFKEGILEFFEQFFQTTHWHDYMKSISNYGARHDRMNISNETFFELPSNKLFTGQIKATIGFPTCMSLAPSS